MDTPPILSIPNRPEALPVVRDYLSRHRGGQELAARDLALVLRLPESEVQFALEALRDDEGDLSP